MDSVLYTTRANTRMLLKIITMYVEKTKIKSYVSFIVMTLIIAFVLALAIISIYDLFVHDITNNFSELCTRYGFLVSPGC
ncbi:MAG TPA: hypothetical protein VK250_07170 [Nitrososphaeraceae archaeon]|nr:hypothetical protein [Nitrososphaeraceae archaeon]